MLVKLLMLFSIFFGGEEFGRVGYVKGEAQILRYGEGGFEYLTVNNIVGEGDELRTFSKSRLEIEFSDGSVLTLGERTDVIFDRVTEDLVVLYVYTGKVRIYARNRYFTIESDLGRTDLDQYTRVRIDVKDSKQYIKVISGRAYFADYKIREGEQLIARENGRITIRPYFDYDSFDYWARDFEERFVVVHRVEYIPVPVYYGVYELERYGRWRYVPPYGWVWVPKVHFGWRPYHDGHWVYRIGVGWVWVPYEPWGWIPYHYGRWAFVVSIGWIWVPGDSWAGAWVEWSYGPDWVAWVPLDPMGRPIYVVNVNHTVIHVWNCVDYSDFNRPVYRYKPPKDGKYRKPYKQVKQIKLDVIKKYKTKTPIRPSDIANKDEIRIKAQKQVQRPYRSAEKDKVIDAKKSGKTSKPTTSVKAQRFEHKFYKAEEKQDLKKRNYIKKDNSYDREKYYIDKRSADRRRVVYDKEFDRSVKHDNNIKRGQKLDRKKSKLYKEKENDGDDKKDNKKKKSEKKIYEY